MKQKIIGTVILSLFVTFQAKSIDLSGGKGLACEALVCAVGIAIPESHAKCQEVLTRWSIYLATLSPFSGKPKCPKVNSEGATYGETEMHCSSIADSAARMQCESATLPPGDYICDEITNPGERFNCENQCDSGFFNGDGRQVCQIR